ncbi:hypothetical protein GA0115254_11552 [Streptomyces sp. Ncost-T10-10d]|nr:hypothetical protein GA0115254_11552 [Streptomyces sp. Ncost-T10-10d]
MLTCQDLEGRFARPIALFGGLQPDLPPQADASPARPGPGRFAVPPSVFLGRSLSCEAASSSAVKVSSLTRIPAASRCALAVVGSPLTGDMW